MALILSIETSTSVCSVGLHDNGGLLAVTEIHQEYSHASKLGTLVQEVMNLAGIKMEKIDAVAISSGPGSYTGLRIGTSLAKGLCYALEIPLIAVSSLLVLATKVRNVNTSDAFLCPMIDARRMEVYCQLFDSNLEEKEPVKSVVVEGKSFDEYLNIKPVIFFGNGAMKCRQVIVHNNSKFLGDVTPSAVEVGQIAYKKLERGEVEDLVNFVPHYLKEFFFRKAAETLNEVK
jgi:tRNA threonylcarbamoyladenosine biosynthesis protein TsaB